MTSNEYEQTKYYINKLRSMLVHGIKTPLAVQEACKTLNDIQDIISTTVRDDAKES